MTQPKPATGSGAAPRDYAPMYLDGGGDPSFAQIDAFLRVHFGGRAVYEAEAASAAGAAAAPHRRTEAEWATDIALTIFRQRNGMDLPYLKAEEIGQVLARWMRRQVEADSAEGAALDMNQGALSPETREYLALRERGLRPLTKRVLQQQIMECEEALAATERALDGAAGAAAALDVEIVRLLECKRHGVVPPERAASFCKTCAWLAAYNAPATGESRPEDGR